MKRNAQTPRAMSKLHLNHETVKTLSALGETDLRAVVGGGGYSVVNNGGNGGAAHIMPVCPW
jgi:hypothetical protein